MSIASDIETTRASAYIGTGPQAMTVSAEIKRDAAAVATAIGGRVGGSPVAPGQVAEALLTCVVTVAHECGPDVVAALQQRMQGGGQ